MSCPFFCSVQKMVQNLWLQCCEDREHPTPGTRNPQGALLVRTQKASEGHVGEDCWEMGRDCLCPAKATQLAAAFRPKAPAPSGTEGSVRLGKLLKPGLSLLNCKVGLMLPGTKQTGREPPAALEGLPKALSLSFLAAFASCPPERSTLGNANL